jgi:hypothetical protein
MNGSRKRTARFARKKRHLGAEGRHSGLQALAFNALLLFAPFLAAHVVIEAFAARGFGDSPTAEAVQQTRVEIDAAFEDMVAVSGDPDGVWANAVDKQLRRDNLMAARGFLLAGPQMMSAERADSLRAAAAENLSGSEDQRLADAALLFLPNDVRNRYERLVRPSFVRIAPPAPGDGAEDAGDTGAERVSADETEVPKVRPAVARFDMQVMPRAFDLVGDAADLASRSARWLRNEPTDTMTLRLRGFAQVAAEAVERAEGETAPFSPADLALGVSVITAGHRAGRLDPDYVRHLRGRVNAALPEQILQTALEDVFARVETTTVRARSVREAFIDSARPNAVRRLALELELVSRIADRTSPTAAMDLIQHARNQDDLRRLRVITEAGGDRAAALSTELEGEILGLADSGVKWTRELSIRALLLCLMATIMVWVTLSALHNSIFHDNRRQGPVIE